MRQPDLPTYKEQIIDELFTKFVAFLNEQGFTKGGEYEYQIQEVFECSKRVLWIDQAHELYRIVISMNSISMKIEYGVVAQISNEVKHREKIEDLRYNTSEDTDLELTENSKQKFDELFENFQKDFKKYIKNGGLESK